MKNRLRLFAIALALFVTAAGFAAQKTPSQIKTDAALTYRSNGVGAITGPNVRGTVTDIADSFGGTLSTNTWTLPQTFNTLPIFTSATNCFLKANGSSALTCITSVPSDSINYLAPYLGAVSETLTDILNQRYLTPQMFDELAGTGDVAIDTAAINAAVEAAKLLPGSTIYFPPPASGHYNMCTNITWSGSFGGVRFLMNTKGGYDLRIPLSCVNPHQQQIYINAFQAATPRDTHKGAVVFENMRFDANCKARQNIYIDYAVGLVSRNSVFANAGPGGRNIFINAGYEMFFDESNAITNVNTADNGSCYGTNDNDKTKFPAWGLYSTATDSHFAISVKGAALGAIALMRGGANSISAAHCWGYPTPNDDGQVNSQLAFGYFLRGRQQLIGAICDQVTQAFVRQQRIPEVGGLDEVTLANAGTGGAVGPVTLTVQGGTFTRPARVFGYINAAGQLGPSLVLLDSGAYSALPNLIGASVTGGGLVSATVNLTTNTFYTDQQGSVIHGSFVTGPVAANVSAVSFGYDVLRPTVASNRFIDIADPTKCIVSDNGVIPSNAIIHSNTGCNQTSSFIVRGFGTADQLLSTVSGPTSSFISCNAADLNPATNCAIDFTATGVGGAYRWAINATQIASWGLSSIVWNVPTTINTPGLVDQENALILNNPFSGAFGTVRALFRSNGVNRGAIFAQQAGAANEGYVDTAYGDAGSIITGWRVGKNYLAIGALAKKVESPVLPTIASGFCTSPVAPTGSGTWSFVFTIGSACATSTGILTMPTLGGVTNWTCNPKDVTAGAANSIVQTASSATSVTFTNFSRTTGLATNFGSGDTVVVDCAAIHP